MGLFGAFDDAMVSREPARASDRQRESSGMGWKPMLRGKSGFTLLELIVAMAMVAVLVTSLYASLRIAFKAKKSAEDAVEPPRTAELAMEFLRGDLQNTIGPTGLLAGSFVGSHGTDDRGRNADDLIFYSTADAADHPSANGEIKNIELTVTQQPGSSDHVLVRKVTRNLLSQTAATPDEEVLCRHVGGLSLRYFDGTQWQDTWDSTQESDTLPAAVEVTLELDRPIDSSDARTLRFVRVFPISCSTAAQANTGGTSL